MSGRITTAVLLAGSILALGACAGRPRDADAPPASALPAIVALRVENRNYNDVVIWLERPGNRTRIGSVSGSSEASFPLPGRLWANPEGIRLAAEMAGQRSARADGSDGVGDRRVVTERLVLSTGQRITWTLESALQRSHVGVQ